ncbi:LacI family DNA-binding transcriptional regulator [Spirosoma sp. KUDC1026]|uniref:LacI family DNA-binding transcriptional regulator n=1 Tax=Spirosoma sp. KUDC1026 TaxID=2745947 RepID=UPI00159BE2AF|nr:substrate-binding domain-containing protein [Spirosoma sp. KUDC1026]QKZ13277.1 substrate-binding domain-containing protein [Spirosoma sp. KUDC1026]
MKKKELQGVKEIARRANVAIATVDRVIHNRAGVSEKTREKINKIIAELNYQPNLLARRLASSKVISIAVLIPSVTGETDFWEAPLQGIQQAEAEIRQFGITVDLFLFNLNDPASFVDQANRILESAVDGIVLAPSFVDEAREFTNACQKASIPFIFIDADIPGQQSLSYIGPPLFQSGYLAGKLCTYRLRETSNVLVVNIATSLDSFTYKKIEEGFRAYFSDHNHTYPILRADIQQTDYASIAHNLQELFDKHAHIDAVFVSNSRVSSVARFLEDRKLPHKPMLIGYDFVRNNLRFLASGTIDFLICHQPKDQGYRSIMALYQHLVLATPVTKEHYMPIDIVTQENQAFYQN